MDKQIQISTKTFIRFWLVIIGFAILAMLIWRARVGLAMVFIALFLAIAITPLINGFQKIIPSKNRTIPTVISFVIIVVVIGGILSVIVPAVVSESTKFVRTLPEAVASAAEQFSGVNEFMEERFGITNFDQQVESAVNSFSKDFVKDFAPNILNSISTITDVTAKIILILFMSLFMIVEGPQLLDEFWGNFKKNRRITNTRRIVARMADMVSKYVSGVLTVCLIDALITGVAIFILSLIFKFDSGLTLPFAFITGLGNMIPVFGPVFCCILVAILMAFSSLPAAIVFTIFIIVYLQFEGNLISPKVQSKSTKLPALVVLIAVTVGMYMLGIIGAIIAIPIAGCIQIFLEEYTASINAKELKE